MFMQVVAV